MQTKKLRRFAGCLTALLLLSAWSIPASAARWSNRSGNNLVINYTSYGITQTSATSALSWNITPGMNYWNSLSRVTCNSISFRYELFGSLGALIHTTPTVNFWREIADDGIAGYTSVYNQDGIDIGTFMSPDDSLQIQYAVVYYNPVDDALADYSQTEFRSVVAHETGHAIGLLHQPEPAVMESYRPNHSSLQNNDINAFQSLYGS